MNRFDRREREFAAKVRKNFVRTHSTRQHRLNRQAKLATDLPTVLCQVNKVLEQLEQELLG